MASAELTLVIQSQKDMVCVGVRLSDGLVMFLGVTLPEMCLENLLILPSRE